MFCSFPRDHVTMDTTSIAVVLFLGVTLSVAQNDVTSHTSAASSLQMSSSPDAASAFLDTVSTSATHSASGTQPTSSPSLSTSQLTTGTSSPSSGETVTSDTVTTFPESTSSAADSPGVVDANATTTVQSPSDTEWSVSSESSMRFSLAGRSYTASSDSQSAHVVTGRTLTTALPTTLSTGGSGTVTSAGDGSHSLAAGAWATVDVAATSLHTPADSGAAVTASAERPSPTAWTPSGDDGGHSATVILTHAQPLGSDTVSPHSDQTVSLEATMTISSTGTPQVSSFLTSAEDSTAVRPSPSPPASTAVTVPGSDSFEGLTVSVASDASSVEASLSLTSVTSSLVSSFASQATGGDSMGLADSTEGYVSQFASPAPTQVSHIEPSSSQGEGLSLEPSSSVHATPSFGSHSGFTVIVSTQSLAWASRVSVFDSSRLDNTEMAVTQSHSAMTTSHGVDLPSPTLSSPLSSVFSTPSLSSLQTATLLPTTLALITPSATLSSSPMHTATNTTTPSVTDTTTSVNITTTPSATTTTTTTTPITTTPITTTPSLTPRPTARATEDVRYVLTLRGDCHLILNNTEFFQRFLAGFHDLLVKQLGIDEGSYRLGEIACGSVRVYVTFLHVTMPLFDVRLQSVIRNGGPGLSVPVWIDSHFATFDLTGAQHVPLAPDDHTYNVVTEVMDDVDIIVIVVACCVCGVLIAIGVAICVKECYRRKHAQTFSLLDVPHADLKLEDFTLTTIPRPRTLYKDAASCPADGKTGTHVEHKTIPQQDHAALSDPSPAPAPAPALATTNGHTTTTSSSNGGLRPSDMHLHVQRHSDGIIVGVTASSRYDGGHISSTGDDNHQWDVVNGTAELAKAKVCTPPGEGLQVGECPASEDLPEDECPASQRLLDTPRHGHVDGMMNPVFVGDKEEDDVGVGGIL